MTKSAMKLNMAILPELTVISVGNRYSLNNLQAPLTIVLGGIPHLARQLR